MATVSCVGWLVVGSDSGRPSHVCLQPIGFKPSFWAKWKDACSVFPQPDRDQFLDNVFTPGQDRLPGGHFDLFVPDLRDGVIDGSPRRWSDFDAAVNAYQAAAAGAGAVGAGPAVGVGAAPVIQAVPVAPAADAVQVAVPDDAVQEDVPNGPVQGAPVIPVAPAPAGAAVIPAAPAAPASIAAIAAGADRVNIRPANVQCGGRHRLQIMVPASALYIQDGGWKCDECGRDKEGPSRHCIKCDGYDRCSTCHAKRDAKRQKIYDDEESE